MFRGARGPIRRRSPRPLLPRCREASRFFPVRDAFHRQGIRCSWPGLSTGDCASYLGLEASPALPRFETRVVPKLPRVVCATAWVQLFDSLSPSALQATRSFAARGFVRRSAAVSGRTRQRTIDTSEGQTPVHRISPGPFDPLRWREGLLWVEPPVDFCNETTTYEHDPRDRLRARREIKNPLRGP